MTDTLLFNVFGILVGFTFMIVGAERLVRGASEIALKLNLSKAFVGAVLVGFGTSAPELFTSLYSAYVGEGTLSVGNVIGSNVFNSTLVMATCLLFPFVITKAERHYVNWLFILLPPILLLIFINDLVLKPWEGVLLLLPLPFFFYYLIKQDLEEDVDTDTSDSYLKCAAWLFVGLLGLYFGSDIAVSSSLVVADHFNLSKGFVGAIILATGTSLPELITTIIAGVKKEISLALANIVGSNALNIFAVLGLSSLIFPIQVSADMAHEKAYFMFMITVLLLPLLIVRSKVFHKLWAVLLFVLYLAFLSTN